MVTLGDHSLTIEEIIDVAALKTKVRDYAAKLEEDGEMKGNFDELQAALKAEVMTIDQVKKTAIEKAAKVEAEKKRQAEEAAAAAAEARGTAGRPCRPQS